MKLKTLLVLSFLAAFSSQAFAQFFPAQANVAVNSYQVTATIYNPYYEPIICNGQVFGQTYYGQVLTASLIEQYMPAGANRFAYVYTNAYAPFSTGWANINCRFARYW